MSLGHWLKHLFGWNTGHVYTWWEKQRMMIGFKCDGCDTITGVHEVPGHTVVKAGGADVTDRTLEVLCDSVKRFEIKQRGNLVVEHWHCGRLVRQEFIEHGFGVRKVWEKKEKLP